MPPRTIPYASRNHSVCSEARSCRDRTEEGLFRLRNCRHKLALVDITSNFGVTFFRVCERLKNSLRRQTSKQYIYRSVCFRTYQITINAEIVCLRTSCFFFVHNNFSTFCSAASSLHSTPSLERIDRSNTIFSILVSYNSLADRWQRTKEDEGEDSFVGTRYIPYAKNCRQSTIKMQIRK